GNHDRAAAGLETPRYFNPIALTAILWTSDALQEGLAEYLASLPLWEAEGEAFYTHSSPCRPETWPYIHIPEEGRAALAYTEAGVCFVGHSHHPFVCSDAGDEVIGEGAADLVATERYLINTGSVGQPRDGDPRAAFTLWDQAADRIEIHRVPYDLEGAQRKIRSAGLPDLLAERLALGR
ncbi:MAG: metallophosphoesterase family protein, partial [Candidatus Latescibacteria bacterium]|nr:metallophosphoesterase family protein [Candidatus Latescibacterota bacterium]